MLAAIAEHLPHYPLDESFAAELPPELAPILARWQESQPIKLKPDRPTW